MRNERFTIATLLMVIISITMQAQNLKKVETYYDPLTQTHIHEAYTTLTTPPYAVHGVYKEWDQFGNIEKEVHYANGKKNGVSKVFYATGAAELTGRKERLGKVAYLSNYSNDVLTGLEQQFDYLNGKQQIVMQKTWVNGEQTKEEAWYENGKPKSVSVVTGTNVTWYENGTKASETGIVNGLEEGKVTEWYENGKLAYSGTVKNKCQVGEAVAYYQDGVIAKKMNFDPQTCKDMHTIQYYNSGKVKWERLGANGRYKVDYFDSLKGFKSMSEEWMDDPRNLNGPLLRYGMTITYYESGKPWIQQNFANGENEGEYMVYAQSGEILTNGQYNRGKKVGKWKISFTENWNEAYLKDSVAFYRMIDLTTAPYPATDYFVTGEKQFQGALAKLSPETVAGKCTWYLKNGSISQEIESDVRGNITYQKNYYEDGKLQTEMTATGSTLGSLPLYEYAEYYPDGKPKTAGQLKGQQKTGTWKYYDQTGKETEVNEGF